VTDTPNAPTPTTPATAEQLREDAAILNAYRPPVIAFGRQRLCEALTRAAAALDAEAARREAPHAELRGWGVMRPDGTLAGILTDEGTLATMHEGDERPYDGYLSTFHRAVPVRLIAEGAE
jgi:hypothetical protein